MNQLMLAMSLHGGGVSAGTMKAIQAARMRNYEKLCMFIKFLVTTLIYGYYWLKKHPDIVMKDGSTQDYTGEGTQALVNAFWSRQDQKDFVVNMIREGADLLMAWLKPDDHEMEMWTALMQNPSPTAQLPDLVTNQQGLLHNLIAQLQQSVPASAVTSGGLPPLPPGMTRDQYFQVYKAWPPADTTVGSTSQPTGTVIRSRTGGL